MNDYRQQLAFLAELDAQHDDVLRQLDDLETQIDALLIEWTATPNPRRPAVKAA